MVAKPELQSTDRHLGSAPGSQLSAQNHPTLTDYRVRDPELRGNFSISIAPYDSLQDGKLLVRELEAILVPARVLPHATSKHRGKVKG
jgi:hypothetical protein